MRALSQYGYTKIGALSLIGILAILRRIPKLCANIRARTRLIVGGDMKDSERG